MLAVGSGFDSDMLKSMLGLLSRGRFSGIPCTEVDVELIGVRILYANAQCNTAFKTKRDAFLSCRDGSMMVQEDQRQG
jgi:hypothetical protein